MRYQFQDLNSLQGSRRNLALNWNRQPQNWQRLQVVARFAKSTCVAWADHRVEKTQGKLANAGDGCKLGSETHLSETMEDQWWAQRPFLSQRTTDPRMPRESASAHGMHRHHLRLRADRSQFIHWHRRCRSIKVFQLPRLLADAQNIPEWWTKLLPLQNGEDPTGKEHLQPGCNQRVATRKLIEVVQWVRCRWKKRSGLGTSFVGGKCKQHHENTWRALPTMGGTHVVRDEYDSDAPNTCIHIYIYILGYLPEGV